MESKAGAAASQNISAHRLRLEAGLSLVWRWRGLQQGEVGDASGAADFPCRALGIQLNFSGNRHSYYTLTTLLLLAT